MRQAYPVTFRNDKNGTVIAEVPDVPGTATVGANHAEALERVGGALVAMLSAMIEDRESIPPPSRAKKGQSVVSLPPLIAAKLAIYRAMREHRMNQVDLAARLGSDARQVRRLLDLHHHSRLDQLEAALGALGKRLVLDVVKPEAA